MDEPATILPVYTRVRTHKNLVSHPPGFLVGPKAMSQRTSDAVGCISGIVPGHGGDVYFVSHIGATGMAVYGWDEFELEPVPEPKCPECHGSGIDFPASANAKLGTACTLCNGTGSAEPRVRPTAWERLDREP